MAGGSGELHEAPLLWDQHCCLPLCPTNEQALACAATGGVVGITGVGVFLGPNDASLNAFLNHVDYAVELVGPAHVGVSTDFPFDVENFHRMLAKHPQLFPDSYTRWGPIDFLPLEELVSVDDALRHRGYPEEHVAAILGGNFRRVADNVWHP